MTVPETLTGLKANNTTKHVDLGVQGDLREKFFTFKENLEGKQTD